MKSLYIDAKPDAHVSLDTGPSLHVITPGRAHGMYPIYRIGRLFLRGNVEIETSALITCLKYGISVTFIDGHGDPEGVCVGVRQRSGTIQSLLIELLEFDNWKEYFDIWMSSAMRQSILEAEKDLRVTINDMRPHQAEDFLLNTLTIRYPGTNHRDLLHTLRGLCYGISADRIAKSNIDPSALLKRRENFELISDLAELLSWKLFGLIDEHLSQRKKKSKVPLEEIARWFEESREDYEHFVDVSIKTLESWLHNRMSL